MLMNYKSAKNHAYAFGAVMRNIHMQQVILSATSHVFNHKRFEQVNIPIHQHYYQV